MIVLIRHAESTFNKFGDKSHNCPITENGKVQASKLRGKYDLIVCSTLKRARQTLDYSNIEYSNIIFTNLCREVLDNNPINLYNGENNVVETKDDIKNRSDKLRNMLNELSTKYSKIAVISHGIFLYHFCGHQFRNGEEYMYKSI